uniref:Ubiquitin-like domain-containing protein n=1 Tax=Echeneis naucrates TaxID=173247 RepID=A0A665TT59_ECHNA
MKVFIHYEGSCEPFDVPPDQTVGAMKRMVKETFLVQLPSDNQVWHYLELSYGGAALQDSWALRDVGVVGGSVIRCLIKSEQRPVMHVFNAVTRETLQISGSEALLHVSVARLKSMVSLQSGLPVSAFRLSVLTDVQLYDCNQLQDYAIDAGTTLRLDTWDGWVEFLQGCLLGHRMAVRRHLSEERIVMRFQMRVALYIAAALGHLDLAGWLLERGVHAEEPVGVHPYRQWCRQTAHQDAGKCPVHVAVESGQLLILKLFTNKNLLTLACRDPAGRHSLKIAIQHGHRDCVRYLANKLFSVVSLPNLPLPMRIYLQVKHWVTLGQKRAACNRWQFTAAPYNAKGGHMLLVDGFSHPQMFSKSRNTAAKPRRGSGGKALAHLAPITPLFSLPPRPRPLSLQPIYLNDFKEMQKTWKQDGKRRNQNSLDRTKGDKFVLPPVPRENLLCSSFSQHCGQTPRENAIYCLNIASTFTEKPWIKQLNIARTLIRKHVHPVA